MQKEPIFAPATRRLIFGDSSASFLVTGGRDMSSWALVDYALSFVFQRFPDAVLLHGDAKGADFLCRAWAEYHGKDQIPAPADWGTHGKAAGPVRNQEMLDRGPEFLVAFPGGRGTQDMVSRADRKKTYIWRPVHQQQPFRYTAGRR